MNRQEIKDRLAQMLTDNNSRKVTVEKMVEAVKYVAKYVTDTQPISTKVFHYLVGFSAWTTVKNTCTLQIQNEYVHTENCLVKLHRESGNVNEMKVEISEGSINLKISRDSVKELENLWFFVSSINEDYEGPDRITVEELKETNDSGNPTSTETNKEKQNTTAEKTSTMYNVNSQNSAKYEPDEEPTDPNDPNSGDGGDGGDGGNDGGDGDGGNDGGNDGGTSTTKE